MGVNLHGLAGCVMIQARKQNKKTMKNSFVQAYANLRYLFRKIRIAVLISTVIVAVGLSPSLVRAVQCSTVAECSQQQQALQQQNAQSQQTVNNLQFQASSYQDAINKLQSQISGLQQQIDTNEATQARLQQQIADAQAQLADQKQKLSVDIKAIYVDGHLSTIEELVTSKNLSDFVDAETYRNAVQTKIESTVEQIKTLEEQLQTQQDQVAQLLDTQHAQQSQLNADQSQQESLLSYNQSQQGQYNQQIQSNQAQITQLQARIIQLNTPVGSRVTFSGQCGGGYPATATNQLGQYWGCNFPKDYNNNSDDWGMYNRECVSYTAFRVHEEYLAGEVRHDMPNWGGVGDAYQWISDARNAGIPVDQSPHAGDIAIRPASGVSGDVGHAMYVESVNGDGTINVSQYNADFQGNYSYVQGRSESGLYFLHFMQW